MRLSTVNAAIRKQISPDLELVKGNGYFYVIGPDVELAYSASVYVYRLNDLSLDRWIEAVKAIVADAESRK